MSMRLVAVLALLLVPTAPASTSGAGQTVTLRYENGQSVVQHIRIGTGANAREFEIRLIAERDLEGELPDLTIEMTCARCPDPSINAMYGGRNSHGVQPFMFSLTGPYGFTGRRTVALPNIGRRAIIEGQQFRLCPGDDRPRICEAFVPITFVPR